MKIQSAKILNYRTHRELSLSFAGNPALVAGPNESGKSTLIEALHRGLFLKAKIGGEAFKHMQSDHGGQPEVEIVFETGRGKWTLRKHFGPTRSSTVLEQHGQLVVRDDEAEDRLAEILGIDAPISGGGALGRLERRWAHIWVRQGFSGNNPSGDIDDHQGSLVARLQAMGGAAVVQSELDSQVHRGLQAEIELLLKAHDQARAGTVLHELEAKLSSLNDREITARQDVARLEGAVGQMEEAEQVIAEKTVLLGDVRQRLAETRQRHAHVQVEKSKLQPIQIELQNIEQESESIRRHIGEITKAAAELPALLSAQSLAGERASTLEADLATAVIQVTQIDDRLGTIRVELEDAQQSFAATQSQLELLERQQKTEELRRQHETLTAQKESLETFRTEIQRLPQVTAKALAGLRKLHQVKIEAESNFKAIATRVDILSGDPSLRIQGQPAEAGLSQSFSGAFEIQAGDALHLRVTPGGGESLSEAIAQRDEAKQKFDDELIKLESSSLEQAELLGAKRADLESSARAAQKTLDASGWEGLEERLETARRNQAAAEAKVVRFKGVLTKWEPAGDEGVGLAAKQAASEICDHLKVRIKGLESSREEAVSKQRDLAEAHTAALSQSQAAAIAHSRAQAIQTTLEQTHGSPSAMAANLVKQETRRSELQGLQSALDEKLAVLGAESVESEMSMLNGSVESQQAIIQQMREQKAAAAALLQNAGTTDPVGDLDEILDCKRQAGAQHATEKRRIDALVHLVSLFNEREAALEHAFTKPLLEKVGGYLSLVFGAGAKAEARYQDGKFDGLSLNRSSQGLGTHEFDQLSGGAKEQLGVAFRLAVAEILAAEHDGCLPLVLDDAFANSDAERVKALQLMIHRASQRGIQIILLTCTPADYAGLGAHEIRLFRPRPGSAVTIPQAVGAEPEGEEGLLSASTGTTGPSAQPGDESVFWERLTSLGGKSGNQALRDALGWDEERYEIAKGCLFESGKLEKGKGKGGSVHILEEAS